MTCLTSSLRKRANTNGDSPRRLPSIETVAPGGVVVIAQTLAFFSAMRGAFRRIASGVASSVTEALEVAETVAVVGPPGCGIAAAGEGWMLPCVAVAGPCVRAGPCTMSGSAGFGCWTAVAKVEASCEVLSVAWRLALTEHIPWPPSDQTLPSANTILSTWRNVSASPGKGGSVCHAAVACLPGTSATFSRIVCRACPERTVNTMLSTVRSLLLRMEV